MSLSEDEDDFLSADEGELDNAEPKAESKGQGNINVVSDLKQTELIEPETSQQSCKRIPLKQEKVFENLGAKEDIRNGQEDELEILKENQKSKSSSSKDEDDNDDDEEEALAERIRERNLRIARKFSAELAKNVKASAPIPVKIVASIGFKMSDMEGSDVVESENKSALPPAPPPTPALSSSYTAEDQPGSSTPSTTQYGWRIPTRTKVNHSENPASDEKSEQARLALDRLSEKMSQSDKNLFEKVAEDIKKVSIRPQNPSSSEAQPSSSSSSSSIPLISELGSTLGGWNWNSASRFLASASQVTSQVGSVLDSVVNTSHNMQQPTHQEPRPQEASLRPESAVNQQQGRVDQAQDQAGSSSKGSRASMSATDAISNDALVDLTLNAMESLGKRAFGVMTERDESGSLQIKGIGRPWEHLLNMNKSTQKSVKQEQLDVQEPERSQPPDDAPNYPIVSSIGAVKNKTEDNGRAALKNRKKRSNYQDDDKLD